MNTETAQPINLTEAEAVLLKYIQQLEERIKVLEEITKHLRHE